MPLLIDTDAFCLLGACSLLPDMANVVGMGSAEWIRLPALTHMLKRGRLHKRLGEDLCAHLLPLAESIPVVPDTSGAWIDVLWCVPSVDPGEALLIDAAIELDGLLVTCDQRALGALVRVDGLIDVLMGKLIVPEQALIYLCEDLGPETVRKRVQPFSAHNKTISVCFSPYNADPLHALSSYLGATRRDLPSGLLWER